MVDHFVKKLDGRLVFAAALLLTVLNAVSPPTVDDPAYLRQAREWAANPSAPYAGETPFYQNLLPAARFASPPVAIAWLALGTRLFGDSPFLLKLWLFPFAWLLVASVAKLATAAAPALAVPLLVLAVISPAVLPSFHFMLEVPALAFATAALAVLIGAEPATRRRAGVAAGVLAGLALQTKYVVAGVLPAIAAWGLLARAPGTAALAGGVAIATFVALEVALLAAFGAGPALEYLATRGARDPHGHSPVATARKLLGLAGGIGAALIPLGLTALRAPRLAIHIAIAALVLGVLVFALAPAGVVAALDGLTGGRLLNFENVTIGWTGPLLALIAGAAAFFAFRSRDALAGTLAVWLLAEAALAPFISSSASVRRLIGASIALALLLGRHAQRAVEREPARRADVMACAALGAMLALGFWAVDLDSTLADRRALRLARAAANRVGGPGRTAYVVNHWGAFQEEARRAGLEAVAADRTTLAAGDRLIVPFGTEMRFVAFDPSHLELADSVSLPHRLPLTTRRSYYDGRLALRRVDPAWLGAYVYRVIASGVVMRSISADRGEAAPSGAPR